MSYLPFDKHGFELYYTNEVKPVKKIPFSLFKKKDMNFDEPFQILDENYSAETPFGRKECLTVSQKNLYNFFCILDKKYLLFDDSKNIFKCEYLLDRKTEEIFINSIELYDKNLNLSFKEENHNLSFINLILIFSVIIIIALAILVGIVVLYLYYLGLVHAKKIEVQPKNKI